MVAERQAGMRIPLPRGRGHHGHRGEQPIDSLTLDPRPVEAIVLSGGGALGAVQVGALKALSEYGVQPDFLVGCSVGALNAAFYGCEPGHDRALALERLWLSLSSADVFGRGHAVVGHLLRRHTHIYDPDALHALIRRGMTVDDLSKTAVPVHVVTTNLTSGRAEWWSTGDPVAVLAASACLPGIFPPVPFAEDWHVDGGVTCPVPVMRALELGADRVWLVDVRGGSVGRRDARMTALDVLLLSFSISRDALVHTLPADARVVRLPRYETGPIDLRDFSRTRELIDGGYAVTSAALGADRVSERVHAGVSSD
jgi:NTE family protein